MRTAEGINNTEHDSQLTLIPMTTGYEPTVQNQTQTQKRPCSGADAFEYDIDIISEELQRIIISRSSCR